MACAAEQLQAEHSAYCCRDSVTVVNRMVDARPCIMSLSCYGALETVGLLLLLLLFHFLMVLETESSAEGPREHVKTNKDNTRSRCSGHRYIVR